MKTILLCLHGWGGSKESFTELREALHHSLRSDSGQAIKGADLQILTPDLPGFGDEPEPDRPWTTDDYADWVVKWFTNKRINELTSRRFFLLGHSHGGRIAIKLAARLAIQPSNHPTIPIDHLFLCAPAGIRHPRHFKRILGLMLAKTGKFFLSIPGLNLLQPLGKKFLYTLVRVHDYEQASPVMRETLIKVSAEDLRPFLPLIAIPTSIFWGDADRMTPVSDASEMQRLLPGSKIRIFRGVRHDVHRVCAREIGKEILLQISRNH